MEKGYIQIYTGNGKGKTTAALGLSLRCLCAGNKVFFGQFMKGQDYSELLAPKHFEGLTWSSTAICTSPGASPLRRIAETPVED
jgi:ATP:corrinoid adenosyltransferase